MDVGDGADGERDKMRRSFEATVSALCYSIIDARGASIDTDEFPHNDAVRFVLAQCDRMPDWLRLPFRCLTLMFDACGVLRGGRRFHRQPPELRARQIERWRHSRLSVCRDFLRFFDSLVLLWWYSQSHVSSNERMDRLDEWPSASSGRASSEHVAAR